MKHLFRIPLFFALLAGLVLVQPLTAQDVEMVPAPDDRPSPLRLSRTTLDDGTYIKVHYSAPHKRDREIFGTLVPFGEVWRTAANEASEITFTQPVYFGSTRVPAGTYSLFTKPGAEMWDVMLNTKLQQAGTGDYDPALNAASVTVPAQTVPTTYEAFTIRFDPVTDGVHMVIRWDQTKVEVPIMRIGHDALTPRPSPMGLARATLGNGTYVKVHYSAPRKKGRAIFGELVPFGQLWRTAANEATELTVTGDVTFGGETLPAGTYTLITIPEAEAWTVVLHTGRMHNATSNYKEEMDALRVQVPVEQMADKQYEAFTINLEEAEGGADLALMWDQTRVVVPIRTLP